MPNLYYRWKIFKATHRWKTFRTSHEWRIFRRARQTKKAFLNETQRAFSFLVEEYGFVRQKTSLHYVATYKSGNVELSIYLDPRCNEMDIGIELIDSQRRNSYGLEMVLEAALGQGHGIVKAMPPPSPDGVKQSVRRLADLVKKHYDPFLHGDASAFELLESVETQMGRRGMERYRDGVRERANLAYQQEDYAMAIRLYEHIQSYLTASDREKLESARRRLSSTPSGET